jgi:hypothetical protein
VLRKDLGSQQKHFLHQLHRLEAIFAELYAQHANIGPFREAAIVIDRCASNNHANWLIDVYVQIRDYLRKMGDSLEEIAIQMETLQGTNDLINKVMQIHDSNNDGVIDRNEFYTPTSGRQQDEL